MSIKLVSSYRRFDVQANTCVQLGNALAASTGLRVTTWREYSIHQSAADQPAVDIDDDGHCDDESGDAFRAQERLGSDIHHEPEGESVDTTACTLTRLTMPCLDYPPPTPTSQQQQRFDQPISRTRLLLGTDPPRDRLPRARALLWCQLLASTCAPRARRRSSCRTRRL